MLLSRPDRTPPGIIRGEAWGAWRRSVTRTFLLPGICKGSGDDMFKWCSRKPVRYGRPENAPAGAAGGSGAGKPEKARIVRSRKFPGAGIVDFAPEREGAARIGFVSGAKTGPCLRTGRRIATPRGEISIEKLRPGDPVITRDNGIEPVKGIRMRRFSRRMFEANPHLWPVLIERGALGDGLPERAMILTPNQRILAPLSLTPFNLRDHDEDGMMAAKHLIDNRTIRHVKLMGMEHVHLVFERTEAVLSNGVWVECFQPHDREIGAAGNAQRNELFELYPEMRAKGKDRREAACRERPLPGRRMLAV